MDEWAQPEIKPEIKRSYIDLCLSKGGCYNIPNHTPFHNGPFVHKHVYYNLAVLSVPGTQPQAVFGSYWNSEEPADIEHCINMFERRLQLDNMPAKKQRKRGEA